MRIRFGDFELDTALYELRQDGEPVTMEPQVFRVLTYLAEHRDRVITKDELLDKVWGDRFVSESALTTRIKQARRAVGDDGHSQHVIKTVHGAGYRFVALIDESGTDDAALAAPSLPASLAASLPASLTPLVGRAEDLEAVAGVVRRHRLVTLAGVGGVGKTRLAAEVARALAPEYADGVRWVELAPVLDAAALPSAVAGALQVTTIPNQSVVDSLASALTGQEVLLVLDNCEHLIDEVAALVRGILGRAHTITILATSREDIRVEGEQVWAVSPLDTSADGRSAAVELFVQRAEAAAPGYSAAEDIGAIVEICRRLDGIALAIELAAARTVSMSPRQICDRLSDRFHLLSNARSSVERHQTLRQAVAWSYDLLGHDERLLLRCCSVFADGFDASGAMAVCGDSFDESTVIDLLDALVRKSLVTVGRSGDRVRFDMLETIRQFAAGALDRSEATDTAHQRHAEHFAASAVEAYERWRGPGQPQSLEWFTTETANLRVAFTWAASRDDVMTAGRIAAHAAVLGYLLQRWEPVEWAEQIVERTIAARPPVAPRVLAAASLCMFTGRAAEAETYDEQVRAFEDLPSFAPFEADIALTFHGLVHAFNGRVQEWVDMAAPQVDDPDAGHAALDALLWHLPALGRHVEAQEIADETVARARRSGNPMWIGWALAGVGRAFAPDDPDRALTASREASAYARDMHLPFFEALNAREAAMLEALHGDFEQGLAMYEVSLDALHRAGAGAHLSITVASMAAFFARFDEPAVAATLIGVALRHSGTVDMAIDVDATAHGLRTTLGSERYAECVEAGEGMALGEAIRFARSRIAELRDANRGAR